MTLVDAIASYVRSRVAAGCSERTVETALRRLTRFADWLPDDPHLSDVAPSLVESYFLHLRESGLADGTLAGHKSSQRAFWSWLLAEGHTDHDPSAILKTRRHSYSFKPVRSRAAHPDQFITMVNSLDAYVAAAAHRENRVRVTRIRDAALISLAVDSSARRSELHNLRRGDVVKALAEPRYTRSGQVVYHAPSTGKTGPMTVRWYFHTGQMLQRWLDEQDAAALWLWTGYVGTDRLRVDYLVGALKRVCNFAGVPLIGWHAIRKRNVTDIIEQTGDAKVGQLYANHADIRTTQTYYNDLATERVDSAAADLAAHRRSLGSDLMSAFFRSTRD